MKLLLVAIVFGFVSGTWARAQEAHNPGALKQGDTFALGGQKAVVRVLDTLPYVENEYTKRFKFDSYDNPKLKELRETYRLDEVVAPGKTEFEKQLLLLDWVNHRFKKFGKPSSAARGALDILKAIDQGNSFFCTHYGDVFVSAAASLGWADRPLALRRPNNIGSGSTEHTSTEIWSNQFKKWVVLDPTFAMYFEKDGVPLNAWEFRQEWFYHDSKDVTFVLDKDHKRYHKADMPVFRGRYPGFGDLVLDPGATNVYAFIGYCTNTDLLDERGNLAFITRDALCDGTPWHKRPNPADPAHDLYFPIDQAAIELKPSGSVVEVMIRTLTPNFKTYRVRIDDSFNWSEASGGHFFWSLHAGMNKFEVRAVNKFGVEGPVSTAEIEISDRAK